MNLDRAFLRCFRLLEPELSPWLECRGGHQMRPWLEHMLKERVKFGDNDSAKDLVDEVLGKEPHAFDGLFTLTNELIFCRDGLPYVTDHSAWHQLSFYSDSDMLIASRMALHMPAPGRSNAVPHLQWPSVLAADGFSSEWSAREQMADLHVHLGGALPPTFYWVALMSGFALSQDFQFWNWYGSPWPLALEEAKSIRQDLFKEWFGASHYQHSNHWDDHQLFDVEHPTIPKHQLSSWQRANLIPTEPFVDYILHWLRPKRVERCHVNPVIGERLLLWLGFQHLWRGTQPVEPDKTFNEKRWLTYLRIRNSFLVNLSYHWGYRGLSRFQETFDSQIPVYRRLSSGSRKQSAVRRRRRLELSLERFRTRHALRYLYADPTDVPGARDHGYGVADGADGASSPWRPPRQLELRVTPKQDNMELRRLRYYLKGLEDFIIFDRDTTPFRMGLIYHVIRRQNYRNDPEPLDFMAQGIHSILERHPEMRRYIVGVDVCGPERTCEPRSLARFFNSFLFSDTAASMQQVPSIRNSRLHQFHQGETKIHIRRTPHVGEDFYDLRTGLRWMDESLRFYGLRKGERVGHGTALAIEPAEWYAQHAKDLTPLRYKVMDLIWLRFLFRQDNRAAQLQRKLDDSLACENELRAFLERHRLMPRSMARFIDLAYKRYLNVQRYPSEEAYLKQLFEDANYSADPGFDDADYGYNEKDAQSTAAIMAKLNTMVAITPSKAELRLLEKARKRVIKRFAKGEIVLEVCPTSNMLIGQFENYAALPYLNINKEGLPDAADIKHPVMLSINSDDPGLFKTTQANEYRLMSLALQERGYRAMQADDWLERQRQASLKASFIPKWSPPTKAELLTHLAQKLESLR